MQAFWAGPPGREDCAFGQGVLDLLTTRVADWAPESNRAKRLLWDLLAQELSFFSITQETLLHKGQAKWDLLSF